MILLLTFDISPNPSVCVFSVCVRVQSVCVCVEGVCAWSEGECGSGRGECGGVAGGWEREEDVSMSQGSECTVA